MNENLKIPRNVMLNVERVLSKSDQWCFDAFELSEVSKGRPLSILTFYFIKQTKLDAKLQLNIDKLLNFIRKIEDWYQDNPYHNRTHAADVLQSIYVLLTRGGLHCILDDVLSLAAILAAACHDVDHCGLSNNHLIQTSHHLAMTYNDISPMENHHAAQCFRVLMQDENNFVQNIPHKNLLRFRKIIIDMVLATDMNLHFDIFRNFLKHPFDISIILQIALKIADINHICMEWNVHKHWVDNLEEEFFQQGDKEKILGFNVSKPMNRDKSGISHMQIDFFRVFAKPLFKSWVNLFPDASPLLTHMKQNFRMWEKIS